MRCRCVADEQLNPDCQLRGIEATMRRPKVGDRIKFTGEAKAYRVRVTDNRFVICTKPFNLLYDRRHGRS